jgi:DNA-binding phage protein
MRNWTTKEARLALEWARGPAEERSHIDEIAVQLNRSTRAVQEFLRRVLPEGQRPWAEKPRWTVDEISALRFNGGSPPTRSLAAIRQYVKRHQCITAAVCSDEESERTALSVAQVATDLGLSRASVYRLLKRGALRRFKGGVAETSFCDLLREHPEAIPYSTLPRDQREWLVLNGYSDPSLSVKRPSVRGLLD